jgi:hypothetical protein
LADQIVYKRVPAAAWPQTNINVAPDNTSDPQLPVPSVQDFGIRLQGPMLLGAELGVRSNLDPTAASSAPVVQPATAHKISTIDAIKACQAELGKHGKYLQVRKCVLQKKMDH